MKKITLVFAFMLAVAGAAAQSMYVHKTDGNVYEFKVSDVDSINFAASTTDDYLYTITYMPNGGTGEMVVDTVVYGDSYTIRGYGLYTKDDDYYINGWNTEPNGSGVDFAVERVINGVTRDITLYAQWIFNIHDYVDLGLPSGTKWATCNVGATKPEEYGNYYAWGETSPKTTYDCNTYKWATLTFNSDYNRWEIATLTKYNTRSRYGTVDNKTVLEFADDAAFTNWGGAWRMPTDAEWTELRENCTWTWTSDYNGTGVKGRIVTSNINGNSIFLPAAGYRYDGDLSSAGSYGRYWSSSIYTDYPGSAWYVSFYSDTVNRYSGSRYQGYSVRPVF